MILSADPPPRVAFSTLAFPDATLARAVSLGRRWGYAGVELRLIDGELIDPSMPAAERARVKRALAGLPVVAVDSSIRLTDAAGHAAQLADLLVAVDTGREPAVSGESGRAALEIVLAVYESSSPRASRPSGTAARSSTAWVRWPGSPRNGAWCLRTRTRRRSTAASRTGAPT